MQWNDFHSCGVDTHDECFSALLINSDCIYTAPTGKVPKCEKETVVEVDYQGLMVHWYTQNSALAICPTWYGLTLLKEDPIHSYSIHHA